MYITHLNSLVNNYSRNGGGRFFSDSFDKVIQDLTSNVNYKWTENENEYTLKIDLPGYSSKEIDVEVEKDALFIKAENKERGCVETSFNLDILYENADKISTKLENGVLLVVIPRNERLKRKKIPLLG